MKRLVNVVPKDADGFEADVFVNGDKIGEASVCEGVVVVICADESSEFDGGFPANDLFGLAYAIGECVPNVLVMFKGEVVA